MKNEIFKKFNAIMAKLKKLEPSSSFDVAFREKFEAAIAKKHRETTPAIFARRIRENIRFEFIPRIPALARVAVTFIAFIAIGLYLYSAQPAKPVLVVGRGVVAVKGAKDLNWKSGVRREIINPRDMIATGESAQLDIELSDKYAIRLKERTKIRIARLTPKYGKGKALFELIEGKMLISIEEGFKGSSFVVDTEAATARAIGTKFAVDISEKDKYKTEVSVLEGKVEVASRWRPEKILLATQTVIVGPGQKTEVTPGSVPLSPQRIIERERAELEELYQIGKKPQVILLIKNTPDRVEQLLRPCPIYISDEKPREIPKVLENAVLKIKEALETKDKAKHLEAVKLLERIVKEYPNPKYDVQFLLYIGAYYEYLDYPKEAIETFEKILEKYPHSPLASLAQCAIGVVYEEKLRDIDMASRAYKLVLERYPNSLEAVWIEVQVKNKKVR